MYTVRTSIYQMRICVVFINSCMIWLWHFSNCVLRYQIWGIPLGCDGAWKHEYYQQPSYGLEMFTFSSFSWFCISSYHHRSLCIWTYSAIYYTVTDHMTSYCRLVCKGALAETGAWIGNKLFIQAQWAHWFRISGPFAHACHSETISKM